MFNGHWSIATGIIRRHAEKRPDRPIFCAGGPEMARGLNTGCAEAGVVSANRKNGVIRNTAEIPWLLKENRAGDRYDVCGNGSARYIWDLRWMALKVLAHSCNPIFPPQWTLIIPGVPSVIDKFSQNASPSLSPSSRNTNKVSSTAQAGQDT